MLHSTRNVHGHRTDSGSQHALNSSLRYVATLRAASSAEPSSAVSPPQPKEPSAAVVPRRQMFALGCACCFNLIASRPSSANEGYTFSYGEEAGPSSWGGMCSTGTQQSPINLPRKAASAAGTCGSIPRPIFQYHHNNNVRVKNTGTTIQVNFEPGNILSWGDQQLELLQYHFHTPSEHAWDGQRSAMEAHLVHRNKATDIAAVSVSYSTPSEHAWDGQQIAMEAHLVHRNTVTGGFVVVGVMMQPPASTAQQQRPNPCLAAALKHVPQQPQTEAACPTTVDPMQLIPNKAADKQFVHYTGSLTTPPCSETVDWLVWEQPIPVTNKQVVDFMLFAGSGKTYGHNSRPLQPLNGRSLEYDCLSVA